MLALFGLVLIASLFIAGCNSKNESPSVPKESKTDAGQVPDDTRNIICGSEIPSEGYCDQPYVVINGDGSWTCTMTTGTGHEGNKGQHIIAIRSTDRGKTWSVPFDIEPADGPEASWVMPLKVPSGRIYAFYTYNIDNMREVIAGTDYARYRVDTLGAYMFRYSDDNGVTWSEKRYRIPVRLMKIDRENPYKGEVQFFWGVGKPIIHEGSVYFGFNKIGRFGAGFIEISQCCFLKSDNILTVTDPEKIRWDTLPDGDSGLVAPQGPIAEESNLVGMKHGSLYCTYRTVDGSPCHAYSRDGGRTWTETAYMTYSPRGRRMKHPRAANFVWRVSNGKYLYWFHNHGGRSYDSRNPAWLCGGIEKDGHIYWSQPEIVLYDDQIGSRMSYPNFIEQDGRYYLTETQKSIARVHEISPEIPEGLWNQFEKAEIAREGLVLELIGKNCRNGAGITMPFLPYISGSGHRGGFAFDFRLKFNDLEPGQIIFDSRSPSGKGLILTVTDRRTIQISINGTLFDKPGAFSEPTGGGQTEVSWDCDTGLLEPGKVHHVTVIVDGGPKVITFIVDGVLCDGGEERAYGWARFHPCLGDVNGSETANIASSLHGSLYSLRLYDRYLRTSEAVGNFKAGL